MTLQNDDDPGALEWWEPLDRPALVVWDHTTPADLSKELEERLTALLRANDHNSGGWREVALRLLIQYDPAFQIQTPVDRLIGADGKADGGAEPSVLRWGLYGRLKAMIKYKKLSQAEAVRKLHAEHPDLKIGTLKNLMSLGSRGKILSPRFIRRWRYEDVFKKALNAAADKLAP